MEIWLLVGIAGLLMLVSVFVMMFAASRTDGSRYTDQAFGVAVIGGIGATVALGMLILFSWLAVSPNYNLWRASIEKRIAVEEALAVKDSAFHLSEAEIERARGVAEANKVIASSIDEQYIRWLYVNNLADHTGDQIIYIPTEGGLPILEATRLEGE